MASLGLGVILTKWTSRILLFATCCVRTASSIKSKILIEEMALKMGKGQAVQINLNYGLAPIVL